MLKVNIIAYVSAFSVNVFAVLVSTKACYGRDQREVAWCPDTANSQFAQASALFNKGHPVPLIQWRGSPIERAGNDAGALTVD